MNVIPSTSSIFSFFCLLSLKLPHSIVRNTGLASEQRKLLALKVVDDNLQEDHPINHSSIRQEHVPIIVDISQETRPKEKSTSWRISSSANSRT
jgi:hypothetical protein